MVRSSSSVRTPRPATERSPPARPLPEQFPGFYNHAPTMPTPKTLALLLLASAAVQAQAQYIPPSAPAPVPGYIDDVIKTQPDFSGWDFIVNDRVRYEDKSDAGTTHAGSNFDFFPASPTTNSNQYWLNRLMPKLGYTNGFLQVVVEGRQSYSFGDDRYTATAAGKNLAEDDGPFQLQMAYLFVGDPKKFPLTLKLGRQELIYGEQRLVGNAFWLNIPHTFDAVKLRYQNDVFGVDVFASRLVYVEQDHFEASNPNDTLSGAYFDFPGLSKEQVTELYIFARNVDRSIVSDNWASVPAPFRFSAP